MIDRLHRYEEAGGNVEDIAAVAGHVVSALKPFMWVLTRLGDATADRGADRIANLIDAKAWPLARSLWARLRHRVASDPALKRAADNVAADSDGPAAQATLRQQLELVLASDPSLLAELGRLLSAN